MHYWWDTHVSASVGNGLILRKLVLTCGLAVPLLVCTILDLEYRVKRLKAEREQSLTSTHGCFY